MILSLILACGLKAPPQPPVVPPVAPVMNADAVAGVTDPALQALLNDHWEFTMASSPVWATQLGDHRFDDRLDDPSEAGAQRWREATRGFLDRAGSLEVSGADALTLELFVAELEKGTRSEVCRSYVWSVSPRNNAMSDANWLADAHALRSMDDGAALLARYKALPDWFRARSDVLRAGVAEARVANAHSLKLTVEMIDRQLAAPSSEWPLLTQPSLPESVAEADRTAFRTALASVVEEQVRPALQAYRDVLANELLTVARGADSEGVWALPDGTTCYEALVHNYTSLPLDPDVLHQRGLDELDRIHAYMAEIGERAFATADIQEIFERLRNEPELRFQTEQEVEDKAASALAKARAAMPEWFGRLPEAECVVERVPDYEAPYTTIAYYRQPSPDGSRPGTYFINVYEPETRPRHEAEVLAFHESIPGHHLQIAISQELDQLPAVRRHMGMTVFVEGWALYTEQLSDEMGLYSGDVDRLGMGSFETWRAARLVVDTGLHHKQWTRQQAIDFMLENTPLAENNITNEVDRYITTPGQALAYKTGQLEIWRLRRQAEAELGDGFDIRGFHDVVLGAGAVTLPVLERRVLAWIEERKAG